MSDYPDLCNNEPSCQKPELVKRISELEQQVAELEAVAKARYADGQLNAEIKLAGRISELEAQVQELTECLKGEGLIE